jgi:hypothetical protein
MSSPANPILPERLPLDDMASRHYGLTSEVAAFYQQAARVCLDRHHTSPVEFEIEDERGRTPVEVDWRESDDRERDAHANRDDATEAGGYICVLAAAELRDGLTAMRRVQVGGRADYYVAPLGASREDLEGFQRLEVSGVDAGDRHAVARRLSTKVAQVTSKGDLPAMAGVIGFAAGVIMLRHLEVET